MTEPNSCPQDRVHKKSVVELVVISFEESRITRGLACKRIRDSMTVIPQMRKENLFLVRVYCAVEHIDSFRILREVRQWTEVGG